MTSPGSPLPVRTERLLLRAARHDDVDDLLAYYGDPSITAYVPFDAFDAESFGPRLERLVGGTDPRSDGEALHVVIEHEGHVVGDVMLRMVVTRLEGDRPPSVAEIGWVLHPAHTGRGLATEAARAVLDLAFTHYGLHRVTAQLDPRNTASARLCERLGMTHEGTTRRDFFKNGEWSDTSLHAILREEWERLSPATPPPRP